MKLIIKFFLILLLASLLIACAVDQSPVPVVDGWKQNAAEGSNYRVQPEDTVYSIAWAFGMDYRDIVRYNNLSKPYTLHDGQSLRMSPGANTPPQSYAEASPAPVTVINKQMAATNVSTKPVQSQPAVPVKTLTSTPQVEKKQLAEAATQPSAKQTSTKDAAPKEKEIAAKEIEDKEAALTAVNSSWLWPTKGRVVQGFSSAPGGNRGVNIAGKLDQAIVATGAGKVVYTGSSMKGYGKLIIIKHNDNELSAYAFNNQVLVKEGDYVKARQRIATMGKNDSGQVLLHFEIRRNGKPVNPMLYLTVR